ncbi:hypothetical protein ANRL3_02908 [Anaerolineae bacterium]|nr:hypothetical protein ANRL3_02908 [Anaerolineae bacterium]
MNMRKLDSAMRGNPNKPRYCHFLHRHSSIGIISHKQRYLIIFLSALTAMMLLSSCCTTTSRIKYRDEVGSVLLSVNSVGRWEQVADAMRPNFNLANGDAALSKVLPATARIQQQILEAFGLSLGLGLPQSFRESMVTRTASENQTSTVTGEQTTSVATSSEESTSKSTATKKPGAAPTAPSGIPASGEFPSGITPGNDLGIDPLLQYRAAASLYQAVQLMNREVELAAKRKNYVPYMVRMQLATIPYRPHLPYDIHAKVAFFPARKTLDFEEADKNTKLPYVVPLIVTDNLEQTIKSRAAEVARQLGLAVSLMVEGVGGNLGSNWEEHSRELKRAADLNSLLTVARLSDNVIYIRLGAANEATGDKSMIGRTYDIALLLLVPEDYFKKKNTADLGPSESTTTPPHN